MRLRTVLRPAFAALAALVLSAPAQAQVFRAYLASYGADTNPCSLPQPCRLLPAALAAVAPDGEIWMLDSANYNVAPVNVTKSVTILAIPGALGSVVAVAGANAIDINTAGVVVTLRNLVIVPVPGSGGMIGVSMTNGAKLTVEGCSFANFAVSGSLGTGGNGVYVFSPGNPEVRIIDTTIRDSTNGVFLKNAGKVAVSGSRILGSSDTGIWMENHVGFGALAVNDSVLEGNSRGILVTALNAAASARAYITRTSVTLGFSGIASQTGTGPTVVVLSNSMVAGHTTTGLLQTGAAVFEVLGNNTVRYNTPNTSGTITTVASN
jgi:hypothetical protein